MVEKDIRSLVTIADYIEARKSVFTSRDAWRWFERQNRQALIESGAMTAPCGKKLLDPVIADRVVSEVGRRRMLNDCERLAQD